MVETWLEIAYEDMEVAHILYEKKLYLYMAHMCQQSIEKAIKAIIQQSGTVPSYTHNLKELALSAGIWDKLEESQKRLVRELSAFYVATRYPETRAKISRSLTSDKASQVLRASKELLLWLCRRLRKL